MISVDISGMIDLEKALTDISDAVLDANLSQGLFIAGAQVQSEARSLVPVDTGALRISIANSAENVSGNLIESIGPTQPYGKEIEEGRPSGTYVSPAALMGWAKRKGLNAYAVSKSIENKGSPAQPFLAPALENKTDTIMGILAQAVSNAFDQALA